MAPDADIARQRFLIINAVRLAGIALLLAGIAVLRGTWVLPNGAGPALVVAGAFGAFLAPTLLARRWSSNKRR